MFILPLFRKATCLLQPFFFEIINGRSKQVLLYVIVYDLAVNYIASFDLASSVYQANNTQPLSPKPTPCKILTLFYLSLTNQALLRGQGVVVWRMVRFASNSGIF